ncbi:hypothetical protein BJ684DRAFT_21948 [Piptocephalis cylindrospora]|uniref:NADH dehydrogenase [ubiquinone] 1 beta subcomplex subunit 2 n=1 Tax=Piptocephalis cylindrospora TaxID=1907219 RepID=A0A4P9Y108_9FUNG|nr:hypothetical protein BJ684DRAFT_21948 [Piptocephalis cylindrospora]|eukprot:RKP11480.1 hypothetical protein BJ684DRAFT_21948 [Piptocephalis cylindrospora]
MAGSARPHIPGYGPKSLRVPHVPGVYRWTAKLMGASMWFFMMYRFKEDGPTLMGWSHPWDHHHGHGHKEEEDH